MMLLLYIYMGKEARKAFCLTSNIKYGKIIKTIEKEMFLVHFPQLFWRVG